MSDMKAKAQLSPAEIENLRSYRDLLEKRATFESADLFPNLDDFHASIVITRMLRHATDVSMYENDLRGDLSDDYDYFEEFLPALEQHLAVGNCFRLVLGEVPESKDAKSRIYELLERYSDRPNVDVRKASPAFKEQIHARFSQQLRFAVADGKMFRYERTEGDRRAYCSFNHAGYSRVLKAEFDAKFKTCERLFNIVDDAAIDAACG